LTVIMGLKLPGVIELVTHILRARDPLLAPIALQVLSSKPDAALEPELTDILSQGDPYLQRYDVRALARLGTPSAIATLQKSSDSEELGDWARNELEATPGTTDEVRARHIQNLGRGSPRPLVALARDPAEAAQNAILGYFSGSDPSPSEWRVVAETATASTVQRLLDRASSAEPAQQLALIDGLAARGDPKFAGALRDAARGEDQVIRRYALRGLVNLGDEDANAALASLVRSDDAAERSFGAELLSTRPDAEATALLETLATDSNADVVNSALGGLQMRAPELAATLAQRAYQQADAEDRPTLLGSLGGLAGTLAMPIYDLALRDPDDDTVLGAIRALQQMQGPESAQRLLAVANETNRSAEVRSNAAASLIALGGPLVRANRALLDALAGPTETAEYVCNARFR
jgi:HEAT repeat protein